MELPLEHEEPTSVIRIMENFAKFTKSGRPRRQLNRSRSGLGFGSDSFTQAFGSESQDMTSKSVLESERERQKDIEILTTKAQMVALEKQLKSIETDRKRGIIELESDGIEKQRKISKLGEEKEELYRELKYLMEKEESAREEAECLQKKLDKLQKQYKNEIDELKKANVRYGREMDELKEGHRKEVNELIARLNQNEVIFYKNKVEENEAQLGLLRSKLTRYLNVVKENEELATKLRDTEYKFRTAEEKISRQEEAFIIAKAMQEKVLAFTNLQKENEKYKDENQLLKDTRENVALITNKYETIKVKYEAAVEKIHSLIVIESENEELKKKIKKWEVEDTSSGDIKARSPLELTRMISDLQKNQLSMVEKQGSLQASVNIKDSSLQKLKEKFDEVKQRLLELEEKEQQQSEKCQRLQRRLQMVTADRDSIRRILNNFDTGMSSVQSNQLRARAEEAESQLVAANDLITTMENENDTLRKEMSTYRLLSTKLQTELNDLKSQASFTDKDIPSADKLQKEIGYLTKEKEELQEKVDLLEARIEQRHLQGDFDPTKTKVLHFAANPLALSRKLHAEQLDNLRDENEDLRRKIKALEQQCSGSSVAQSSLATETQSDDGKQVQELKSRLDSSELQNKRLKEVFTNTVQDFRESCYQLFGYKNDMIGQSKFKLLSMYAERPDDHFIFQMNPDHQLEMIDTDFSHHFKDAMDIYLHRGASIPAFLSSITLDLFSKQTQIIDSSLFKVKQKR